MAQGHLVNNQTASDWRVVESYGIGPLTVSNLFGQWDLLGSTLYGRDEELTHEVTLVVSRERDMIGRVVQLPDEGRYADRVQQLVATSGLRLAESTAVPMLNRHYQNWQDSVGFYIKNKGNIPPAVGFGSSAGFTVAVTEAVRRYLAAEYGVEMSLEEQLYSAAVGEAETSKGELILDNVAPAVIGGIVEFAVPRDKRQIAYLNPEDIKINPIISRAVDVNITTMEVPEWYALLVAPEGFEKFGGVTAEVRAQHRRSMTQTSYVPELITKHNAVVHAIRTRNLSELAVLTEDMHPMERFRVRQELYADGKMTEQWLTEIKSRSRGINVATNVSGTGPGVVFVYELVSEPELLRLVEEMYGEIGLKPLYWRTTFSSGGTRVLTPRPRLR